LRVTGFPKTEKEKQLFPEGGDIKGKKNRRKRVGGTKGRKGGGALLTKTKGGLAAGESLSKGTPGDER